MPSSYVLGELGFQELVTNMLKQFASGHLLLLDSEWEKTHPCQVKIILLFL